MSVAKLVCATTVIFAACCSLAHAQSVEDFYKGKRLTVYVGSSPGGGTDVYARILANYIGNFMPGRPVVAVSHVPGANGLVLANQLQRTLPKDGTALATFDRSAVLHSLWENPAAQFAANEINWIGSLNIDTSTCVTWHTTGIDTLEKFLTQDVVIGSTAVNHANLLNSLFGAKIKQITGYPGGNDVLLALERGEVQGRCNWSWSSIIGTRPQWVKDRKLNIIVQFAEQKHSALPDVPLVTEMVKNERQRMMIDLILTTQTMARPFAAPPGVPKDRVNALRQAFMAMAKDREFLATAEGQALEISPVAGDTIQTSIARVSALPREVIVELRDVTLGKEASSKMVKPP